MILRFALIGAAATLSWTGAAQAEEASDAEFQELFVSWEALEEGGQVTRSGDVLAPPSDAVSVPSLMPVDGVRLTSAFGMRVHPILRQRKQHNGVDLAAPRGTPVYATADGVVGLARYSRSYGYWVEIAHGGEIDTRYAHLQSYTVRAGDEVKKGDIIGYVGSTGRSTGPHLHYEVRVDGEAVNPMPYMVTQLAQIDEGEAAARGGE